MAVPEGVHEFISRFLRLMEIASTGTVNVNLKLYTFGEVAQRFEGDLRCVFLPRREAAEPIMSLGLAAYPRPLVAGAADPGAPASGSCCRGC